MRDGTKALRPRSVVTFHVLTLHLSHIPIQLSKNPVLRSAQKSQIANQKFLGLSSRPLSPTATIIRHFLPLSNFLLKNIFESQSASSACAPWSSPTIGAPCTLSAATLSFFPPLPMRPWFLCDFVVQSSFHPTRFYVLCVLCVLCG